jgi:hypothetical protein
MYNNVTMINDLPQMEDMQNFRGTEMHADMPPENYQKFIRNTHHINPRSGMSAYKETYNTERGGYNAANPGANHATMSYEEHYTNEPGQQQHQQHAPVQMMIPQFSCLDVSSHIQNCPICSKLYYNEKTLYIIAIVVLCIICLLLLKRILNI